MVWIAWILAATFMAAQTATEPRVNRDAKIQKAFADRVAAYVALHKQLEETLPTLADESEAAKIHAHQLALARLIAKARAGARAGDIMDRDTRALLRRLIRAVVRGPEGQGIIKEVLDENTRPVPLQVNGPYPSTVPLSTVPPKLLSMLPRLPEEVEFRFVGRQLILFDLHAQIIADFMADALP
jgi:hypothetical protein